MTTNIKMCNTYVTRLLPNGQRPVVLNHTTLSFFFKNTNLCVTVLKLFFSISPFPSALPHPSCLSNFHFPPDRD